MTLEFLLDYGLFLAKIATVVIAIIAILVIAKSVGGKSSAIKGELEITNLSEHHKQTIEQLEHHLHDDLVIIAGVGGDLTQKLVDDIHRQHPDKAIDFLLCPVHQQFELRSHLKALNFGLIDEMLIEENRRYYEVLLVSNNQGDSDNSQNVREISNVGDKIWAPSCDEQMKVSQQYKAKTLQHYLRIHQGQEKQGKPSKVKHIIEAYQAI